MIDLLLLEIAGRLGTGAGADLHVALEVGAVAVGKPEHGVQRGVGSASSLVILKLGQQLASELLQSSPSM